MAFDDEARQIGSDFLFLVEGNLRERSKYFQDNFGINIPYSSWDAQWNSLINQLGIVDAVKKIVKHYIDNLDPKAIDILRKSTIEAIPAHQMARYHLYTLVNTDTRQATELGLFVLRYGPTLSEELGRLTAVKVYQISACINRLLQTKVSDKVVLEDGSLERYGTRTILGDLQYLDRLVQECGLAQLEREGLREIIDNFKKSYPGSQRSTLSHDGHTYLLRVLGKIEAVVNHELTHRDFSELKPKGGVLDYQKLPIQVVDGLLGEMAYSIGGLVRKDLEEAIRCLRFQAPTASVMIGLRAVEGWLRELYRTLTGKEIHKGWAEVLKEIQSLLDDRSVTTEPVAGFLNYIRDVRNKADHPDKSFSQVEAEQIFVAATTAIRELEKLK